MQSRLDPQMSIMDCIAEATSGGITGNTQEEEAEDAEGEAVASTAQILDEDQDALMTSCSNLLMFCTCLHLHAMANVSFELCIRSAF